MPKVKIDTDKISKDLLPAAKTSYSEINTTKSYANNVYIPYGEYNWSNVSGQIRDCADRVSKYYDWVNSLNKRFVTNINRNLEEIQMIQVEAIQKSDIIVK